MTSALRQILCQTALPIAIVLIAPAAMRLVGFDKVFLNPGRKVPVQIVIDPSAITHPLSYWNSTNGAWTIAPGPYQIYVGNSVANIEQQSTVPPNNWHPDAYGNSKQCESCGWSCKSHLHCQL